MEKEPESPIDGFLQTLGLKQKEYAEDGFWRKCVELVAPAGAPWPATASLWAVRLVCALMLWADVGALFLGAPSWDKNLGRLSAREAAIARAGVMFDHGFRLPLFLLVLAVSELGDQTLRAVGLSIATFALALNGPYGVPAWLGPRAAGGVLLYDPETMGAEVTACTLVVGVLAAALAANLTAGFKEHQLVVGVLVVVGAAAAYQTLEKNGGPIALPAALAPARAALSTFSEALRTWVQEHARRLRA